MSSKITSSSTAEYFSKNLQQVGFSSGTKAVLTTLKEAVDNSLDACEEELILPEIYIEIQKVGTGSHKGMDAIRILVRDNGPGIPAEDLTRVFGEYLASSKFGKGRCSRGQQGIGISAATTWGQMTSAKGVNVITKTTIMRKAISATVAVDIKKNIGVLKTEKSIDWDQESGVSAEFFFDGRLQLNGEAGVLTYLVATSLVNPHLKMTYKINDDEVIVYERVSDQTITIPEAVPPHPHTMKLGEFISHATLFGKSSLSNYLKTGFSRISDQTIKDLQKAGVAKKLFDASLNNVSETDLKTVYSELQKLELMAPSTKSVLTIGEEALSKSIKKLGEIDFFSVVSRKPTICDAKPVVIEVAVARLLGAKKEADDTVDVLRFANRVPLQFDKGNCAIVRAIETVNWKSYGLGQGKGSIPQGPYVIAVSVVSPFIKFKNASKETIDASDELVEEIRLALMQAGQRLSRFVGKEKREADLENKRRHIEQFGPILIEGIGRIIKAPRPRLEKAKIGLMKILGREEEAAEDALKVATDKQTAMVKKLDQYNESDYETADETAPAKTSKTKQKEA